MSPSRCPVLAQSRHCRPAERCPLLGVKRTWRFQSVMSAFDPKRTSRNLDTTQRPTGSRCVWATKPSVPRRPAALRVRRTQLSMSATGTEAGRAQLLLVVPENVSELWPRHTSSPGFFLNKRMRAADTSLTRPKKHSPKSFRSPVGIVKKEPCGVHCLHGQRECIDCGSAGYGFQ
jgi:hypothetical protein